MNLEEKAQEYIKPFKHQLPLGSEESVKDDFKAGYRQAIKDIDEILRSHGIDPNVKHVLLIKDV